MEYPVDLGGRFASDVHRRVLAHLSLPEDDYGWSTNSLLERMRPDVGTDLTSATDLRAILEDLEKNGHAQQTLENVWQMTQDGFDLLTGSIANEPPPGGDAQAPKVPATVGMAAATKFDNTQEA